MNHFNKGWYAVAEVNALANTKITSSKINNTDIVVYKTTSGEIKVSKAHCPHLGAHLGHGKVVGENIKCPFHGFEFDTSGNCAKAYIENKTNPAKLPQYPVAVRLGIVFVWWGSASAEFDFPEIDDKGWMDTVVFTKETSAIPSVINENIIDFGHLAAVHNGVGCVVHKEFDGSSEIATVQYSADTIGRFEYALMNGKMGWLFTKLLKDRSVIRSNISTSLIGPGLTHTINSLEAPFLFGWKARIIIMTTPLMEGRTTYRFLVQMLPAPRDGAIATMIKKAIFAPMVARESFSEVDAEFYIWESMEYKDRPNLAVGDGPIIQYRKWLKQFRTAADVIATST